jgi:CBS domain-containing protein
MTEDPVTASPDDAAAGVARKLAENRMHRAVVIDRERIPIGIVTSLDLLKALAG